MTLTDYPFLFTITDRFSITGHGVVIIPGIPSKGVPLVKRGDPLILRTPLGEIIEAAIRDLEMIRYGPGAEGIDATAVAVLLPSTFHKFDIPIGTEVFLGISNQTRLKNS